MPEKLLYSKKIKFPPALFYKQYKYLSKNHEQHLILESGRGGRYSIAAFTPSAVASGKDGELVISTKKDQKVLKGNPLHSLKDWMSQFNSVTHPELPDFQGGAIGYISYDYARYIERLPSLTEDDLQMPDIYFMIHDEWFLLDHQTEELWLLFSYEEQDKENVAERAAKWEKLWCEDKTEELAAPRKVTASSELEVSLDEPQFMAAVERIQQYISAGDVFQVNLSVRQSKALAASGMDVYDELRVINPSPYMGYMHTPDFQFVSASPELLIKKLGEEVSTRPIAGTRSRGKTEEEDYELANELIENEKERAEHVMLVDLERNDLGRVCAFGTVEVNEFMVIEKYSHVMHIVSNVRGSIAQGKDSFDLIDAVFPGGTITGAPKIRTMEIIEELETVRRGPYTGSMGWIGYNDDMELNIMIRTMLVKEGKAHIQAGAGIVIDSNPKNEYKESLKKAAALWKAKEMAERGEQL